MPNVTNVQQHLQTTFSAEDGLNANFNFCGTQQSGSLSHKLMFSNDKENQPHNVNVSHFDDTLKKKEEPTYK